MPQAGPTFRSSEKALSVPAVARWQQLASMDPQSPDFLPLLSSLTAENHRSSTTELCGDDAGVTLDVIDKILSDGKVPSEYGCHTICTMRTLAYNSGQVPPHYQVDRQSFSVGTRVIANGYFADVREGKLGGKTVAVRTLRTDQQSDRHEAQKRFCKECIVWMNVSHPNLLELIAVDINPDTGRYSMISEMMTNGNIKEYIRKNTANRHHLLKGAATGLHYLHGHEIVHGDLKGLNILITNGTPPQACLADFGLSTLVPGAQGAMTTVTAGGTPAFMAPELLCPTKFNKSSARPTQPADIYAFGMVIYEVLTGLQPFHEKKWNEYELVYNVMTGARPTKPADAEKIGFGNGTWELVEECWIAESTRRPTIDQILTHLTSVAAHSKAVDPTPAKPCEAVVGSAMSDSSSEPRIFFSKSNSTDGSTSDSATSPVSVWSTASTALTATSGAASVPSSIKKYYRPKFKLPTIKLPFQRSVLTAGLLINHNGVASITPIPLPLAVAPKSGLRRFIDKLKPGRPISFSTTARRLDGERETLLAPTQ